MKSKKILFALIFLLQIHGASAGQSDKKIHIKEDSEEKSEGLGQQNPKSQKEITLEDLINIGENPGHAAKKLDLSAEGEGGQDQEPSPSQSNFYESYGREGGEDQLDDSYDIPEGSYEYAGSAPSDSQSDVGRGRGEEEGGGSIKSLEAQKSDPNLEPPDTHRRIRRVRAEQNADSSEDKKSSPLSNHESSYAPSDKDKSDDVQRKKNSRKKQSKLSGQQESDHEGKELDHKNHQHSDEEEKDDSNYVVKKPSRKKQPRQ
jgi:hypothetical protein